MVFIITGAAESSRNTVGQLLAENLGWDFIDANKLCPPGNLAARKSGPSLDNADPTLRLETLSAAIHLWIYEWRDVVISCPMLTDNQQKQLSKMSPLVKVVCLEASHAPGRTSVLDQSVCAASSEVSARRHSPLDPMQKLFTVDASRKVEEIIAEMTAVVMR